MAQVPEKVLAWLYNVLQDYPDTQRAYADVARVLSSVPSLVARTEVHTFENGASSLLLTLTGTLPTAFRGTVYQFPVKVWIPKSYPHDPPFLYVTPGKEMQIRAGQHVGVDGRIYHPYLRDWPSMWDRASIAELLGFVQQAFSKEPPVMSRSVPPQTVNHREAAAAPALPPKQHHGIAEMPERRTPPPRPPKSTDRRPENTYVGGQRDPSKDGPPLPPLPGQRTPSVSYAPSPSQPASQYRQPQQYNPSTQTQGYTSPNISQSSLHSQGRVYSPAPTQGQPYRSYDRQSQAPQPRPVSQYTDRSPSSNLQYSGHRMSYIAPQSPYQAQPSHRKPAQDLLSDPFDVALPAISAPPPPVPVNPEKEHLLQALSSTLVQQAQQKINQNVSAIVPLQAQQTALRAAYNRLEGELAQIQTLDAAIANNESILRRNIQECDHTIEAAKTKSLPPVDDVLVAQTLVAQQLWTATAEEAACREAMYVLQTAVDRGRINGSDFVRQMRGLGRECFLKMALARKCAQGMGLEVRR